MARLLASIAVLCLLAPACASSNDQTSPDEVRIVAAFYPLAFVAERVAGDDGSVTNLSPPGVEPHDLELAPDQVRALAESDLVVYVGAGFQPAVEDIVGELTQTPVLDALASQPELLTGGEADHDDEQEGATDPHVWLDPVRLATIAEAVAAQLAEIDPGNARSYEDNANRLGDELAELDDDFATALEDCERRQLVVSHEAFGYLTDRYGLKQVGVSGIDPESEPAPGRLAEVADFVDDNGVTTIFFEEQVAPDIAEVIAEESGATTAALDPLEFPPGDGSTYLDVMRENLDAIGTALGCSS